MRRFMLSCGLLALAAGSALAGDVWVGNNIGRIDRNRPMGTETIFSTLCTQVMATTASGQRLYLADSFGNIWSVGLNDLTFEFFPQTFMTNALTVHNGDLLAACTDGKVRRIRTTDGAVTATLTIGGQVHALTVDGDTLYMGGHDTFIRKGNANTGPFQVIGACGGQVHSIAINGNELLASSMDNRVYRINKANGQYITQWNLPAGMGSTQIAMDGAYMIAGGADGLLRWFNPATGSQFFSTSVCTEIRGLAVVSECKADMDRSGGLTPNDFSTYLNVYAAASPHADMDGNTFLNPNDFTRYMNAYLAGCP
jgi:outer membrane protein assembly factor BamB